MQTFDDLQIQIDEHGQSVKNYFPQHSEFLRNPYFEFYTYGCVLGEAGLI